MVSQQQVKILIEAQENVTNAAKKAESALNKLGAKGNAAMQKINNASSKIKATFSKLHSYVDKAREKFQQFSNSGNKLGMIKSSISNMATSFGKLIPNTISAKNAMEKLKSVSDTLQTKFTSLQTKLKTFSNTAKTSLKSAFSFKGVTAQFNKIGASVDKLRGKISKLMNETRKSGSGFGFLKNAVSTTAGIIGYDLVSSIVETTRASMNARSSIQAFGSRLNMSQTEVSNFQKSLDDLQKTYKKIDMDVVGQQATDMAYRLGLPKISLPELTETTAIFTDAMQRNGRSAEDSMLAMSDAMDGEFRRLKEIGISQQDLMDNDWDGDINNKTGLLKAMNKALKDQHYDELAKSVDNLDDAWAVLSVTMSNLLEKILVPLTPVIVGIVNAFADVVTMIMDFVGALQGIWSGLPEWAQMAILIAGVAIAVGVVIAAFGGLEGAILAIVGALAPVLGTIGTIIASFSWPVVAVVAAVGLLAAAVYEVGKAFGWWSDVGSMLDAIQAGVMRLWNAFINHPDVQAMITGISDALQWLGGAITNAGQQVMEFFGISSGGNWDVVRAIIDGVGAAWDSLKFKIQFAVALIKAAFGDVSDLVSIAQSVGQQIQEAFQPVIDIFTGGNGIVPSLEILQGVFEAVWTYIVGIVAGFVENIVSAFQPIMDTLSQVAMFLNGAFLSAWNYIVFVIQTVVNTVRAVIGVFQQFLNGQMSLPQAIMTIMMLLYTAYNSIFGRIRALVIQFASQMLSKAIQAGRNFVTGVLTWLKQLPAKVYSELIKVVSKIISAGARWVSSVKQQAQKVVDGARNILSKTAGAITGALSGVADAITAPFRNAYNTAKKVYDDIVALASKVPIIGGGAAGGDAFGGETLPVTPVNTTNSNNTNKGDCKVSGELTIVHDLKNVPSGVDEVVVARLISESLSSDDFVRGLAGNLKFQEYDLMVKQRIDAQYKRARGV